TNKTHARTTFLTNITLSPKRTGRGRFDHPAQYVNYALPLRKCQFPGAASVRRGVKQTCVWHDREGGDLYFGQAAARLCPSVTAVGQLHHAEVAGGVEITCFVIA